MSSYKDYVDEENWPNKPSVSKPKNSCSQVWKKYEVTVHCEKDTKMDPANGDASLRVLVDLIIKHYMFQQLKKKEKDISLFRDIYTSWTAATRRMQSSSSKGT